MSNTYKLGTSVKISGAFTDENGDDFDPTSVTAMVKIPDGTETSYVYGTDIEVQRDGLGQYSMWVETPAAGTYAYRFKAESDSSPLPTNVANEDTFDVDESAFTVP